MPITASTGSLVTTTIGWQTFPPPAHQTLAGCATRSSTSFDNFAAAARRAAQQPPPKIVEWTPLESFLQVAKAIHKAWEKDLHSQRGWWINQNQYHKAHPAVLLLLEKGYWPVDRHALVLEWPHVSETDKNMLAYTQSPEKGDKNLQIKIKPGRYLKRHFPQVSDEVIRDVVILTLDKSRFEIIDDMEKIVELVQDRWSVWSCMGDHENDIHPYRVYSKRYGWALAVRYDELGAYAGRALVNNIDKTFVRTYQGNYQNKAFDVALQDWLEQQGYHYADCWADGLKLEKIDHPNGYHLAPYLDGDTDHVNERDDCFVISYCGKLAFDNQDGHSEQEDSTYCPHCNDAVDEEDLMLVRGDDRSYCCPNCEDEFVQVRVGRYTHRMHRDDAVLTRDDTWIDPESPGDYRNIDCGQYSGEWDEVDCLIHVDGDWWHEDDVTTDVADRNCIILCTAGASEGDYVETRDAFRCLHDGEVYADDDGYTTVDDGYVADVNMEAWEEAQKEEEAS